jgi:hypothetical protein
MDKRHIVTGGTLAYPTRCEPDTAFRHPRNGRGQIVHPQSNVIERWNVDLGGVRRVEYGQVSECASITRNKQKKATKNVLWDSSPDQWVS